MADLAKWDLRGPVRSVETHLAFRDKPDRDILEFRPDGAIARHWHRYQNGLETTETFSYDSTGKLISLQFENSAAQCSLWIYEYDALGRLLRQFSRDASGVERNADTYSHDANGRMTKIHRAPQTTGTYGHSVDGKAFYSGPHAAVITTIHNPAGQPAEMLFQDSGGALVSRVDFQYDDAGNLIEEAQSHMVSPFASHLHELKPEHRAALESVLAGPMQRSQHRYDEQGRRIETLRSLFGSLGNERITMEYNQHGDLVAQTSREESREYGFDDQDQPVDRPGPHTYSETRFVYEYDSHGNWTSKIAQGRADDHSEFSSSISECRTIVYYDAL